MVLRLQISANDIAVTRKNSILKPLQNLIRASFVESEIARQKERGFLKLLTFFSFGPLPRSGIHSVMSKAGQRQAGEAKLLLSDRHSPGKRRVALI